MTIQVRRLLIRAQVSPPAPASTPLTEDVVRELERAKAQLLAECKAYVREQLKAASKR